MVKTSKFFYFSLFFLLIFLIFPAGSLAQESVFSALPSQPPAPTLISPDQTTITADLRPLIVGLTKDQTLARIFIDGVYVGQTEIFSDLSGTASFAYRPSVDLSRGWHKVYAVAEAAAGQLSGQSETRDFKIEWPMPAPTMIKTVVNQRSSSVRPFITGLAKNNSRVKVYIDEKYSGEFLVKNHESGTANFAYRPSVVLSRGNHSAYTIALDQRGKASIKSNLIIFQVKAAAIAQAVREERQQAVANLKEAGSRPAGDKNSSAVISPETGKVEVVSGAETSAEKKDLAASTSPAAAESVSGMVNENRQGQEKLQLSMILFILFLVGIIGWLVWVNRELVKERRAETEKKDKPGGE